MPHMLFTLNKHYRIEGQKREREERRGERKVGREREKQASCGEGAGTTIL